MGESHRQLTHESCKPLLIHGWQVSAGNCKNQDFIGQGESRCITTTHHLSMPPLHTTSPCHLCKLPLHSTSAYHLCTPPLHHASACHMAPLHTTSGQRVICLCCFGKSS